MGKCVQMTPQAINEYNRMLCKTIGARASLYDLEAFREGVSGDALRRWLAAGELPADEPLWSGEEQLSDGERENILKNRNLDHAAECPAVRWGVCVRRSNLRRLPVQKAVTREKDDRYDDVLQESAVLAGEPLAILHESRDALFYFAVVCFGMGWIAAEDVGVSESYAAWRAVQAGEKLVVTGSSVRLCCDPYEPEVSARTLTMGEKLRLAAPPGTVRPLRGRMSYDNYMVELPRRTPEGGLDWVEMLVPVSADVHVGPLSYTRKAVIRQAMKTRGEGYGWGGLWGMRDCSGLIQEIYRCFGFSLPRNTQGLALLPGAAEIKELSMREKERLLCGTPAGAILFFPGHVMLYLGRREGRLLCLSAVGNFLPEGETGGKKRAVNTVTVNSLDVVRANGKTWLESLEKIIRIP